MRNCFAELITTIISYIMTKEIMCTTTYLLNIFPQTTFKTFKWSLLRIRDIASSVYVKNIYHMQIVILQATKNSFLFRKISLFIK